MKCPFCSRTIISKVNDNCLFCGKLLPENMRLTPAQKSAIKAEELRVGKNIRALRDDLNGMQHGD